MIISVLRQPAIKISIPTVATHQLVDGNGLQTTINMTANTGTHPSHKPWSNETRTLAKQIVNRFTKRFQARKTEVKRRSLKSGIDHSILPHITKKTTGAQPDMCHGINAGSPTSRWLLNDTPVGRC
jgi:hypothetical protein